MVTCFLDSVNFYHFYLDLLFPVSLLPSLSFFSHNDAKKLIQKLTDHDHTNHHVH